MIVMLGLVAMAATPLAVAASLARHSFSSIYLWRDSFTEALFIAEASYMLVTYMQEIYKHKNQGRTTYSWRYHLP